MDDAGGAVAAGSRLQLDVALQVRPRCKTAVARDAGLRIVQAEVERRDLVVAPVRSRRERVTKPRDRFGVAVAVETDEIFGLFLQVVEIQPIGQSLHEGPPCIELPSARNTGCTKALIAM